MSKRPYRFKVRVTFETEAVVEAVSARQARAIAQRWGLSPWINRDPDRLRLDGGMKVAAVSVRPIPKE